MPLRIMITGPHAIGKTTTAKALVKKFPSLTFVPSLATVVANELNYDLNKKPSHEEIMNYQERLLQAYKFHFELTGKTNSIYDRSPLDLMAYAGLGLGDDCSEEMLERVGQYSAKCADLMMQHCDCLIIPECDLSEKYDSKEKRPEWEPAQAKLREQYVHIVEHCADSLRHRIRVIKVPSQYQYEDRVEYLARELLTVRERDVRR
jgi:hypothetical protein